MKQSLFILILLAGALVGFSGASAQSTTGTPPNGTAQKSVLLQTDEAMQRWTRVLERIDDQLKNSDPTAGTLKQLRETAVELQKDLTARRPGVANEVEGIKKLIEALGAAPKEGEPAESDEIAKKREQLNERLSKADGTLKQLDLLTEKSKGVLATISTAEGVAFGNRLLTRTPSLFDRETWSKSGSNIETIRQRAGREFSSWRSSSQVSESAGSGFFIFAAIAVLLSAVLAWGLRRWLLGRFGRDPNIERPTYRMRVRAALAEATARTAIPIVVALAAYGTLRGAGFLFGFVDKVAAGLVLAVIVLSVLYGVPRSMLSPSLPQWRLASMHTSTARLWYVYALILAAVVAVDTMLVIPATELRPTPELQTTYNFIIDCAYALIFFLIACDVRLWRTPAEEARRLGEDQRNVTAAMAEMAGRSKWWRVARTLAALVAIAIPVAALAGYGVLSDFIARRLLATAGVFLIALVLHGLARDVVAILTHTSGQRVRSGGEASPLYVWTVLFLDIGLVLTMAFLIVPLWGGQWDSILDRLGWSLTGFRIGDRVFSITDVLAGMVAFIIVIVIARSAQHFISRRVFQQMRMDSGVRDSLTTAIGYTGLVLAVVVAISTAGIDLSGLAIVAGALSVGVGFGLQSIVNNFVSGLILLAERPIKVGDWVQVGEHEGIVQRISVRSTEIKTFSRASVIVPNSELISNSVMNWMHKERSGRLEILVGVGYDSDVEQVRDILLQIADEHDSVSKDPEPVVMFMDFGDNALLFELRCVLSDVGKRLSTMSDLRFAINAAFREAGISIPYPQRDLHIKDAQGLVGVLSEGSSKKTARAKSRKTAAKKPTARRARTGTTDPDD